jgi:uncharacterized protein HemX
MNALLKGLAKWWASSQATNIIIIAAALAIGSGGIYIQQLRVKAAECAGNKAVQQQVERLAEIIEEGEKDKLDEALDAIEKADHPCLDVRSSDIMRNGDG